MQWRCRQGLGAAKRLLRLEELVNKQLMDVSEPPQQRLTSCNGAWRFVILAMIGQRSLHEPRNPRQRAPNWDVDWHSRSPRRCRLFPSPQIGRDRVPNGLQPRPAGCRRHLHRLCGARQPQPAPVRPLAKAACAPRLSLDLRRRQPRLSLPDWTRNLLAALNGSANSPYIAVRRVGAG